MQAVLLHKEAVKLCRYCRRFIGKTGKNGICQKCWSAAYVYPAFKYIPPEEFE